MELFRVEVCSEVEKPMGIAHLDNGIRKDGMQRAFETTPRLDQTELTKVN